MDSNKFKQKFGLNLSFLDNNCDNVICEKCNGIFEPISSREFLCPACREMEIKNNIRQKKIDDFYSRIPLRYRSASCADFSESQALSSAKKWVADKKGDFLLITGATAGTGKTHLATAIVKKFIEEAPCEGLIESASDMLLQLRGSFDENNDKSEIALVKNWQNTGILLIDDIGAEKSTEFSLASFYQILNCRYIHLRPTILTSNLTGNAILDIFGERIFSRITSGLVITMDGDDLRAKNRSILNLNNIV